MAQHPDPLQHRLDFARSLIAELFPTIPPQTLQSLTADQAGHLVSSCAAYRLPAQEHPKATPQERRELATLASSLPLRALIRHMRSSRERVVQIRAYKDDGMRRSTVERWMEGCLQLQAQLRASESSAPPQSAPTARP